MRRAVLAAVFLTSVAWAGEPTHLVAGDPDATVTIAQYSDYLCPHCATAFGALVAHAETAPNVKLELYPWPLTAGCNPYVGAENGSARCLLAVAAECGRQQDRYRAVAASLLARQEHWTAADVTEGEVVALAVGAGAKRKRLERCMDDPATLELVRQDAAAGGQLTGTPTFFVSVDGGPRERVEGGLGAVIERTR